MTKARNSLENEEVDLFQNHKIQRQICDLSFKNEEKSFLLQDVSKRKGAPKKVHKLASYFAVGSSKKKKTKAPSPKKSKKMKLNEKSIHSDHDQDEINVIIKNQFV